jgi:hypothetical protein
MAVTVDDVVVGRSGYAVKLEPKFRIESVGRAPTSVSEGHDAGNIRMVVDESLEQLGSSADDIGIDFVCEAEQFYAFAESVLTEGHYGYEFTLIEQTVSM